ncbi:hypothetical protein CSUI_001916 [Cystoisospora suis]|uniref:Uncharacterized protein n=1 Tax=Cystoisospora suis TaxID=483139 RepID=A0A2C6LAY9_9APIC|nr:hypothetical protein CSUI_001916 [Cystoisospora suis]
MLCFCLLCGRPYSVPLERQSRFRCSPCKTRKTFQLP